MKYVEYDPEHTFEDRCDLKKGTIAIKKDGSTVKVTWRNFHQLNDFDVIKCMMYPVQEIKEDSKEATK